MKLRIVCLLVVVLGSCGCDRADEGSGEKPQQKLEDAPVAKESAWTWGYFFEAPDKAAVKRLFGERKQSLTVYRVEKVVTVRDKPWSVSARLGGNEQGIVQ